MLSFNVIQCHSYLSWKPHKKWIKWNILTTVMKYVTWSLDLTLIFCDGHSNSNLNVSHQLSFWLVSVIQLSFWLVSVKQLLFQLQENLVHSKIDKVFHNISTQTWPFQNIQLHSMVKLPQKMMITISYLKSEGSQHSDVSTSSNKLWTSVTVGSSRPLGLVFHQWIIMSVLKVLM